MGIQLWAWRNSSNTKEKISLVMNKDTINNFLPFPLAISRPYSSLVGSNPNKFVQGCYKPPIAIYHLHQYYEITTCTLNLGNIYGITRNWNVYKKWNYMKSASSLPTTKKGLWIKHCWLVIGINFHVERGCMWGPGRGLGLWGLESERDPGWGPVRGREDAFFHFSTVV